MNENGDSPLIWVFSLVSGETYRVFEDELPKLGKMVVALKEKPRHTCRQCYGRFHIGFNTILQIYQPCTKCARKYIDFDRLNKNGEIELQTPKIIDYVDASDSPVEIPKTTVT